MFLKSYTELAADFDRVQTALVRQPRPWLAGMAAEVERDGERLLADVGLELGGVQLEGATHLDVGEPAEAGRVTSLPLRLRVDERDRRFPAMEGTLDAAWLGEGRTHLALSLQYEPPSGLGGRTIDRALLHRVAEAIAGQLLERVAAGLQTELPAPAPNLAHVSRPLDVEPD